MAYLGLVGMIRLCSTSGNLKFFVYFVNKIDFFIKCHNLVHDPGFVIFTVVLGARDVVFL